MNAKTLALLSQPNAGKSTLFNGLTGSRQHVGNWPGKTVEKKQGNFSSRGIDYIVYDLPGSYSLSANSDEEVVTRDFIASEKADMVVLLVDASQCERSLYMLADYIGITTPVLVVFNMIDVAKQKNIHIDIDMFEKKLGVPCVAMSANNLKGYEAFYQALERAVQLPKSFLPDNLNSLYRSQNSDVFDNIQQLLPARGIASYQASWLTAKLIEDDPAAHHRVKQSVDSETYEQIQKQLSRVSMGNLKMADAKFEWIKGLLADMESLLEQPKYQLGRMDRLFTGRFGKIIAIAIIILGLVISFIPAMPFMNIGMNMSIVLRDPIMSLVSQWQVPVFIGRFFIEVVLMSVGFCFSMAGFVLGVSLVFGFLEETGYMARISYVFDNTMSSMGLQGKSVMPILVSFGCTMAGTGSARVIDTWGQKTLTIMMAWAIPCAATWSVIGLTTSTFFGVYAPLVIIALFVVVLLHFRITAKLFGKKLVPEASAAGLIMELPPYHKPKWTNLLRFVYGRFKQVFFKALKVVFVISTVLWLLSYTAEGDITHSVIYQVGKAIEPVTLFFGLPWQLFIAWLISGLGKESALGAMSALFGAGGSSIQIIDTMQMAGHMDLAGISGQMTNLIHPAQALAFVFAFAFNMPCTVALASTNEEIHSVKWTAIIAVYYILSSLTYGFVAYRIGLVFL